MAHNPAGMAQELASLAHDVMHMNSESNLLLLCSTCRSLLSFSVHERAGQSIENIEDRFGEDRLYVNTSLCFIFAAPDFAARKLMAFCIVACSDNNASLMKPRMTCFTRPLFVKEGLQRVSEVFLVEREVGFRSA